MSKTQVCAIIRYAVGVPGNNISEFVLLPSTATKAP